MKKSIANGLRAWFVRRTGKVLLWIVYADPMRIANNTALSAKNGALGMK
jgi:hypothetical protein